MQQCELFKVNQQWVHVQGFQIRQLMFKLIKLFQKLFHIVFPVVLIPEMINPYKISKVKYIPVKITFKILSSNPISWKFVNSFSVAWATRFLFMEAAMFIIEFPISHMFIRDFLIFLLHRANNNHQIGWGLLLERFNQPCANWRFHHDFATSPSHLA